MNIKTLIKYIPQEFQIDYADALPKEIDSTNIKVTSESTNDSQNKEKEQALILDILQDIRNDTIKKIPKAYKPKKTNGII